MQFVEERCRDDVSIERYLSSKSEIIGDDASISHQIIRHRNHKSSQSSMIIEMIHNDCSYYLPVFEHGTKYAKALKGTLLRSKSTNIKSPITDLKRCCHSDKNFSTVSVIVSHSDSSLESVKLRVLPL